MDKLEHFYIVSRTVKWYSHFGEQFDSSSKCKIYSYPITWPFHSYICSREVKTYVHTNTCTRMFIAA